MNGIAQTVLILNIFVVIELTNVNGGLFGFVDEGNTAKPTVIDNPIFGNVQEGIFFHFMGIVSFPIAAEGLSWTVGRGRRWSNFDLEWLSLKVS